MREAGKNLLITIQKLRDSSLRPQYLRSPVIVILEPYYPGVSISIIIDIFWHFHKIVAQHDMWKLIASAAAHLPVGWNVILKVLCILYRIYTFVLVPRLATCTNICMPLFLCKWTVFTCVRTFTCLYMLTWMNHSHHSSPLTRVRKLLRRRAPRMARQMTQRMTRRICNWYTRRLPRDSPRHSRKCVNAVWKLSRGRQAMHCMRAHEHASACLAVICLGTQLQFFVVHRGKPCYWGLVSAGVCQMSKHTPSEFCIH